MAEDVRGARREVATHPLAHPSPCRLHPDSLQRESDLLTVGDNPEVRICDVLEDSLELELELEPEPEGEPEGEGEGEGEGEVGLTGSATYTSHWLRDHCYTPEARSARSHLRSLERVEWCAADLEAEEAADGAALDVSMPDLLDRSDDDAGEFMVRVGG